MPGYGLLNVKCEPLTDSEDEESDTQCVQSYLSSAQVSSTVEPRPAARHDAPAPHLHQPPSPAPLEHGDMLRHLHQQPAASLEELSTPPAPAATPVCIKQEPAASPGGGGGGEALLHAACSLHAGPTTIETLESASSHSSGSARLQRHLPPPSAELQSEFMPLPLVALKDEPHSEGEQPQLSGEDTSDSFSGADSISRASPKSWTQQDMDHALEALRKHNMSLTKASATYGIPSTTLWQRAHRLGIDTPKKEGSSKSWTEADLRGALHALRAGAISANKASKAYGIPSSTLYKIARREGIRLAAPFNAAPTSWRPSDLERALDSIRAGHSSVQRASAQFGIPTGTLYGRCKREGIELSRSNPTPWSEDAMGEALEAVRVGQMSINQAAIHYNLPYSSLYGRFKRCKYPQSQQQIQQQGFHECPEMDQQSARAQELTHQPYQHAEPAFDHSSMYHAPPAQQHHTVAHDPSMLTNVILHDDLYTQQAMYYTQPHTNGITTS